MDPVALGPDQWGELGKLLTNLWMVCGLVLLFAGNMMIGHIIIPSLVASFHLPSATQRARPVFYGVGAVSFVAAAFLLTRVMALADVAETFWKNSWI